MDENRFGSFLGSLCLHLGVIALVLLWPGPEFVPPPLMNGTMVTNVDLTTIGAPGKYVPDARKSEPRKGDLQPTPVEKQPDRPKTPQEIIDQQVAQKKETQVPAVEKKEPVPPKKEEPLPDPDAIKVPDDPKKVPQLNATEAQPTPKEKPEEKKEEPKEKPEEKPEEKKKEEKKQEDKKEEKKEEPPKAKEKPKEKVPPKKTESLADVLKDIKAKDSRTGKTGAPAGRGGGSLSNVLQDMGKQLGGSGQDSSGGGPGGAGGDGIGILGAYEASVVSRVKPNWSFSNRADRKVYSALVRINIASDGSITKATLLRSSGNELFDQSLLTALDRTKTLEPPPQPDLTELELHFSSTMLQSP